MRTRHRKEETKPMLPERSTLLVPEFPRPLRLRIKALANLRDQTMHQGTEDLLEQARRSWRSRGPSSGCPDGRGVRGATDERRGGRRLSTATTRGRRAAATGCA